MTNVQRAQGSTSRPKTVKASAASAEAAPTPELIAARAYEIWQEKGCPEGSEQDHWYQAEGELLARAGR